MLNIRPALLVILSVLAISCGEEKKSVPIKPIVVKTIEIGNQMEYQNNQNVGFTGKIIANKTVNLSFQIGGTIEVLNAEMGDFVQKGALLAKVDATAYKEKKNTKLEKPRPILLKKITSVSRKYIKREVLPRLK